MKSRSSRLASRLWCATAVALLVAVACGSEDPPPTAPPPPPVEQPEPARRILFVGNSLTQTNDLPAMVAALGAAVGVDSIWTEEDLIGGSSLEDHLVQGSAAYLIAQGDWDVVVLQQGPSTQPDSRVFLRRDVRTFDDLAKQVGARTGVYGVWPPAEALDFQDAGIESYRLAAEDVNGLLFPASLAWKIAWRMDPAMALYGPDRFHPSIKGTYLAALVMASVLFHHPPSDFPGTFRYGMVHAMTRVTLTAEETATLQAAATEALQPQP
jgi:hypothetical protein